MKNKIQVRVFDILALISSILALIPNLLIFFLLFYEQIKTGWGFPTNYEMMVLLFWLIQLFTLPLILFGLVYIFISIIKRNIHRVFAVNTALNLLSVAFLLLSVVFEHY